MNDKIKTQKQFDRRFPGISKKKEIAGPQKPAGHMEKRLLRFAVKQKCVISPAGYAYYVKGFKEFGRCPCDARRLNCPCPEAVKEIQEEGHCLCKLFWKNYDEFIVQMIK